MISVTNKKMVGNIGTAQIWLPYAYYQAKRLELDMDKLGQTVGYRNIILDDDSRVYLFAKDGVMNITVEGAGFNPNQQEKLSPEDWDIFPKEKKEEFGEIFIVFTAKCSERFGVGPYCFMLDGTYNKHPMVYNTSQFTIIPHFAYKTGVGFYLTDYPLLTVADGIPAIGSVTKYKYNRLNKWNITIGTTFEYGTPVTIDNTVHTGNQHVPGVWSTIFDYTYSTPIINEKNIMSYTNSGGIGVVPYSINMPQPSLTGGTYRATGINAGYYYIDGTWPFYTHTTYSMVNQHQITTSSASYVMGAAIPIRGEGYPLYLLMNSSVDEDLHITGQQGLIQPPFGVMSYFGDSFSSHATSRVGIGSTSLMYGNMLIKSVTATSTYSSLVGYRIPDGPVGQPLTSFDSSSLSSTYGTCVVVDKILIKNNMVCLFFTQIGPGPYPVIELSIAWFVRGTLYQQVLYSGISVPVGKLCYDINHVGFLYAVDGLVSGGGINLQTGKITTTPRYEGASIISNLVSGEI